MTDFNFRDVSTFVELADNLGRKRSFAKPGFGVTVPRLSSSSCFELFIYPLSSCLFSLWSLSIMLSCFSFYIHLSLCLSVPPFILILAYINFHSLSSWSVYAASLCPLLYFIFFSLSQIFLSHSPAYFSLLVFFFFTSLRVDIVLFWSKICPIWFPVVGMNLGKLLNFPSPQFPHLYDEGVGPSRK